MQYKYNTHRKIFKNASLILCIIISNSARLISTKFIHKREKAKDLENKEKEEEIKLYYVILTCIKIVFQLLCTILFRKG